MRMSSGYPPLMAALCGLAIAILPAEANAQERTVANDVPSCREFAEQRIEVTLTRPTEVPQLLSVSWNGATHQQADSYLNRDITFPAPVLVNGLPTRALPSRHVGLRNWFRPGTDNAFQCAFQTTASAVCSARASAPEGTFITLLDLLAANPVSRFQATVTVTETFVRPEGEVPAPVTFPATQALQRAPNQVGVSPGSVRWIYTATAALTPNCAGRPTGALFANGVPTPAARVYLAGACTPVNGASFETLYGWNPVQRYAGSELRWQAKIRALPGRVVIPRSSAFKSVAEHACLALPQLASHTDEALRCQVAPDQFTAWNRALIPATVAGLAPVDLTAVAQAAAARLDGIAQGPTCADAERIATAEERARHADMARETETGRKEGWKALAESRGTKIAAGTVALLALAIALILVIWDRARQRRADQAQQQAQRARDEEEERVHRERDDRYLGIDRELGLAFEAAKRVQPLFENGSAYPFKKDVETELEQAGEEPDPLTRVRVVGLTLQALELYRRDLAEEADRASAARAAAAKLAPMPVPISSRMTTATPPGGISTPEAEGAYAFFRAFMGRVYAPVNAGSRPEFRSILDRANNMTTVAPKKEWEELASMVVQHVLSVLLRGERLELARTDLVKILGERGRPDQAVNRKNAVGMLTRLHAHIAVLAEILESGELVGDKRLAQLFEERFKKETVAYAPHSGAAPPAQGGPSPSAAATST